MTRKQWEARVIEEVAKEGGFSIFWVTSNQFIACAADRLVVSGRIVSDGQGRYPWIPMKLKKRRPKYRQK